MLRRLLALLVALAPSLSAAETIATTTPVYQDMSGDDAVKLAARFEEGLRRAGATVVPRFGEKQAAEFVSSLVVSRKGKEIRLSALLTRVRLDSFAVREDATANGHDDAALGSAIDQLASRIASAASGAPPRTAAAPPPPKRAAALKARLEERESDRARTAESQPPTLTNDPEAAEEAPPAEAVPATP